MQVHNMSNHRADPLCRAALLHGQFSVETNPLHEFVHKISNNMPSVVAHADPVLQVTAPRTFTEWLDVG